MVWKKLGVVVLFFSFFSCIRFYHDSKGGFRPVNPKFTLGPQNFILNNKIDTLAIYVKTDTLKYAKYKSIFYLKFYNNARYFESSISVAKKLTKTNMKPGFIGYYTLKNNFIEIEYFLTTIRKYDAKYVKLKGIIKGDSLIFNNRFVKGDKDIYVKQKIDFIPKPSNW